MFKLFCFITITSALMSNALAQNALVLDDTLHLNRGIYKNFKEFRKNSPSILVDFTVDTVFKMYGLVGQNSYQSYKIKLNDPHSISKDQKVWGFCDGKSVYINSNDLYRKGNIYDRIVFFGRYCLFSTLETAYFPVGAGVGSTRYLTDCLFDINMGLPVVLSKESVRELLQKDPELLAEFEKEEKKGKVLTVYVKKYALKHPEEIKR